MDIASTNLSRLLVHTFLPSLNIYSSNPTNLSKEIRSLRFSNRLKKEDDVRALPPVLHATCAKWVWHRACQPVNATLHVSAFLNIPTELSRLPSITSTTDHVARSFRDHFGSNFSLSPPLLAQRGDDLSRFFNIDLRRFSRPVSIILSTSLRKEGFSGT